MAIFKVTLRGSEIKAVDRFAATNAQKDFWHAEFLNEQENHEVFLQQLWDSNVDGEMDDTLVYITDRNDRNFLSVANSTEEGSRMGVHANTVVMEITDEDGNVISNNFSAFDFETNYEINDFVPAGENFVHAESIESGVFGEFLIETDYFDFIDLNFLGFTINGEPFVSHVMWKGETEATLVEGSRQVEGVRMEAHFGK